MKKIQNIDKTHSEFLDNFENNENVELPKLTKKKQELLKKLKTQNLNIDVKMNITDEIKSINEKIKQFKLDKKNYFLNNSKHLFHYFEEKKNISNGTSTNSVNMLNSFFKIKSCDDDVKKPDVSKEAIIQYWKNVHNNITNLSDFINNSNMCYMCLDGEMIPQEDDGIIICNNPKCGQFVTHIMDSSKPNNKEPPHEVSYTSYIRLNHFKEILAQFQAKETTQIPEQVLIDIINQIKKERIKDLHKELTYGKMREILRKLGYNKYFEHIQYINSLFGIRPPIMSEELHETLCVLFIEIQKPWAIHCPANRTNFFNYTYTLYQLCVLLDQTQYLPYIPLMKDREKQLEQDQIWKKVCEELDWVYYPTV